MICKSCTKDAYYGYTKPIYCSAHKKEDMLNLIIKKCKEDGCNTRATQNYPDTHLPMYCAKHKSNGMIDVVNRKCKYYKCGTRPSFGFINKKAIYCVKHKEEGMVYLRKYRKISNPITEQSSIQFKPYPIIINYEFENFFNQI